MCVQIQNFHMYPHAIYLPKKDTISVQFASSATVELGTLLNKDFGFLSTAYFGNNQIYFIIAHTLVSDEFYQCVLVILTWQ